MPPHLLYRDTLESGQVTASGAVRVVTLNAYIRLRSLTEKGPSNSTVLEKCRGQLWHIRASIPSAIHQGHEDSQHV